MSKVRFKAEELLPKRLPRYRVHNFRDVACMYYPDSEPHLASRRLRYLISRDPLLSEGLKRRGFAPRHRDLSPRQLGFLMDQLGTPESFYAILNNLS